MAYTAIDDPEAYFQVKLYTGNAGTLALTFDGDTDMQPDLVWIKARADTESHNLYDAVRGTTKHIETDTEQVENVEATSLTAFGSDGFTVGAYSSINHTTTYVAWNWKESATSGFDIVAYTGDGDARTISHNLSAVPNLIIIKDLEAENHWIVYHNENTAAPETDFLILCETTATQDDTKWNDTLPTSSVFSLGADQGDVNTDGNDFIAYLFAEKQGFSQFGTYVGNGSSTDGAFVYTGFRPAFIIRKNIDGGVTENWIMLDNKRNAYNPVNEWLAAEATSAEGANGMDTDFCSNGFKMRSNNDGTNRNATTYVYAAFAEAPFVNSKGVPGNAR